MVLLGLRNGSTVGICSHDEVTRETGAYYTEISRQSGHEPVTRYTNTEEQAQGRATTRQESSRYWLTAAGLARVDRLGIDGRCLAWIRPRMYCISPS